MPTGGDQKFGNAEEFAKQMKMLVNNKDLHDIQFLIGPARKKVFAHRCILSGRCEVFRAMLVDHAQKTGPVDRDVPFVLSDMVHEVFLALLEFIYTNSLTLTSKIAIDVMATALEYGMDDLKTLCEDYLVSTIDTDNACDRMQAAHTYRLDGLKRKTLEFIEKNTKAVFESPGMDELGEEGLCAVLASDHLQVDEMDVFNTLRKWASVNAVVVGKKMCEVGQEAVRQVRLALLGVEELEKLEEANSKDHFVPTDLFAVAWKFHATKKRDKNDPMTTKRRGTAPRDCHKYLQDPASK